MKIKQLTIEEFNKFKENYPEYSIYQTVEYGLTMNNQGFQTLIVGLVDQNDNILAGSILLIEKHLTFKYAYAPRGFLIDYQDFELLKIFTTHLKKFLAHLDIVAVKFNPAILKAIHNPKTKTIENIESYDNLFSNLKKLKFHHYGYNFYFEALKPRYEAIVEIDKPYYTLFKNIKKEYQTKIRNAERNGINIHKGRPDELKYIYSHTKKKYPRNMTYFNDLYTFFDKEGMIDFYYAKLDCVAYIKETQRKYCEMEEKREQLNTLILMTNNPNKTKLINRKVYYNNVFQDFKNNLVTATNLLKERDEGIILATIMVTTYRDTVYILMDGYEKKFKSFNAKHLLIWKIMEKYSKLGFKKFNLGGVSSPELETNKFKGLNTFKINFGAKIYEYAGDFEMITNNTKYFMYRNTLTIKNILKK